MSKTKKKTRGRRPLDDKAVMIRIFPRESRVEALGGDKAVKTLCIQKIEEEFVRLKGAPTTVASPPMDPGFYDEEYKETINLSLLKK